MMVAPQRIRLLSGPKAMLPSKGGVVYWMSRDQRAHDNWALLHAQSLAKRHKVGLSVIFCLVPTFLEATVRQYGFMLSGLRETEGELRMLGIPFQMLSGNPVEEVPAFVSRHEVCALVTDFSPLRVGKAWKGAVGSALPSVPLYEVDAHNVVPVWVASDKQEVGARTIRKKINDKLPTWLVEFPQLEAQAEAEVEAPDAAAVVPTPSTADALEPAAAGGDGDGGDGSDGPECISEAELAELTGSLERAVAAEPADEAAAEPILDKLERVKIDRALLSATGAGKAVNNLAKARGALSARARALVEQWRADVIAAKAAAAAGTGSSSAIPGAQKVPSAASARVRHPCASLLAECAPPTDWAAVDAGLTIDRSVAEVGWLTPGPTAAKQAVTAFCDSRLALFADKRNDPNVHALSDLSPYLHFGHLSAQRMALMVKAAAAQKPGAAAQAGLDSFLEESIVRRELADNFCFYNAKYDSLEGAAGWARDSLELHASDKREHVYTLKQLEGAQTHEDIWNAAQRQMARTGKMHGFMRM